MQYILVALAWWANTSHLSHNALKNILNVNTVVPAGQMHSKPHKAADLEWGMAGPRDPAKCILLCFTLPPENFGFGRAIPLTLDTSPV